MIYFCCEEKRRNAVRNYQPPATGPTAGQDINGIDYLEVVDHEEPVLAERQRLLRIFFVKDLSSPLLELLQTATPANIRITGVVRKPSVPRQPRSRPRLTIWQRTSGVFVSSFWIGSRCSLLDGSSATRPTSAW